MAEPVSKWTRPALILGSVGLAVYWYGTSLFFDFGGLFAFGAILVLATLVLGAGIASLYRPYIASSWGASHAVMLLGMGATAVGLVAGPTATVLGLCLLIGGAFRSKALPVAPLLIVLTSMLLLSFEELRYGVLVAIRNDRPLPTDAEFTVVRWLAGTGYLLQAIGWSWLAGSLRRTRSPEGTGELSVGEDRA